jgi:hypothetical protein
MALPTTGLFGPITPTLAKDLAAITAGEGLPCSIGTTSFDAVPLYIGKDILASLGISGVRGEVIQLHCLLSDLPAWPVAAQTPITVNGVPMTVRDASREGDGTLAILLVMGPA